MLNFKVQRSRDMNNKVIKNENQEVCYKLQLKNEKNEYFYISMECLTPPSKYQIELYILSMSIGFYDLYDSDWYSSYEHYLDDKDFAQALFDFYGTEFLKKLADLS